MTRFLNDLLNLAPGEYELKANAADKLPDLFGRLRSRKAQVALKLRYVDGAAWPTLALRLGMSMSDSQRLIRSALAELRTPRHRVAVGGLFKRSV